MTETRAPNPATATRSIVDVNGVVGGMRALRDALRFRSVSRAVNVIAAVMLLTAACGDDSSVPADAESATSEQSTTTTPLAAHDKTTALSTDQNNSDELHEELQPIVDSWAERNNVTALAVSVISPSGAATSIGYSADSEAPSETSLFVIASVSKPMMAATTLLLAEEGVLGLDEPIESWLPQFPRADEITLRQLLADTAGLQDARPGHGLTGPAAFAEFERTRTKAELLAEAAEVVSDDTLPAPYHYSNAGFWVVGAVIESAVGQSLAEVMQARIFEPLGMTDTYLAWPDAVDNELVEGEVVLPNGQAIPLGTEIIPAIMSGGWGAGGVLSNTRDVATFYHRVFDNLLAPASIEAMQTTTPGSGDYGLAIDTEQFTDEAQGWGTGGAIIGYTSAAGITDDGWSVAVLTNHFDVTSGGSEPSPMDLVAELLLHINAPPK